ncbi:MAG: NUDIX hydrolase, partial [Planktomarina sp.]
ANSALKEAYEEGGVKGQASDQCVGVYTYSKIHGPTKGLPKVVMVFPIKVDKLKKSFPEMDQRKRKWFSLKKAAQIVDEKQLSKILKSFDPVGLH